MNTIHSILRIAAGFWISPLLLMALLCCERSDAQIVRVSVADDESQANAGSYEAAVSEDGGVVAFRSSADNLVAGDANNLPDIYVRDLDAGTTEPINLRPDGQPSADFSKRPSISNDGRFVVFEAKHPDSRVLVSALRDRQAGTTEYLVPNTTSGNPAAPLIARLEGEISGDGRFLVFYTRDQLQGAWPPDIRPPDDDRNIAFDVFAYDLETKPTPAMQRLSRLTVGQELDADSRAPSINQNGNQIAFETFSDLIPGDANNAPDIVVKNRLTGVLELISVALDTGSGNGPSLDPHISGDATAVAFRSAASDLVANDTNGRHDVFVHDRSSATITRVSVATGGVEANHHSMEPSISDDGRFVAFRSLASNLVAGDTNDRADIFVHDRNTGETTRIGQPPGGESNGSSAAPAISGDGAWIVFESDATNLVAGDTNDSRDIFRAPNPLLNRNPGD